MLTTENILRRVILRPYRRGCGPTFRLVTWIAAPVQQPRRSITGERVYIGYRLTMSEAHPHDNCVPSKSKVCCRTVTVLFEGEDFGCSPMDAIDSDECIRSLMAFLTLRPGDTDPEYFADYTPAQLDYCDQHAEALACECMARFGEDN